MYEVGGATVGLVIINLLALTKEYKRFLFMESKARVY